MSGEVSFVRDYCIIYNRSDSLADESPFPSTLKSTTRRPGNRVVEKAEQLSLDKQLCFTLYATSLAMTKAYRPLLASLGLTYPQYIVMMALWEHGELSAGALGAKVALDSGTLVPLVRKLTASGFVERRRSPSDDRSVLISLTREGQKLGKSARAVSEQIACATRCTDAQIQTLLRSLRSLRAALLSSTNEDSTAILS